MAWLSGYEYRKKVTLSHASGAVTNYQMKLLVGESAGATGEDVDCGGKVLPTFNDLRFTTSDGITHLNHWIESIAGTTPNQLATVWIKFDSIGTGATTFYMYYGNPNVDTVVFPSDVPTLAYWKHYGDAPVLPVGAAGQWDDFWVGIHSIWKEGSTYYAYYNGKKSSTQMQIGLATSTDGITWTKSGSNPVLTFGGAGKWDDYVVGSPNVWKEGSTWYMLFNGGPGAGDPVHIGLATSADGITWSRYDADNPVMSAGASGAWDDYLTSPGTIMLKEGNTYYLYYEGSASSDQATRQIGLATSSDLHTWTKSGNNPILAPVGSGKEFGVGEPCVIKNGSTYYMWYQMIGDDANYDRTRIGLATSSSRDSGWTKSSGNPILGNRQLSWNTNWTEVPVVIQVGTQWRLYYAGSGGSAVTPRSQGGYAVYTLNRPANVFLLFDNFNGGDQDSLWTLNSPVTKPSESGGILTLTGAQDGIKSVDTYQYKRFRALINFPSNTTSGYRNWAGFKNNFNQTGEEQTEYYATGANPTTVGGQSYLANFNGGSLGSGFTGKYSIYQLDRIDNGHINFYIDGGLLRTNTTEIPTASLSAWLMTAISANYYTGFTVDWIFVSNLDPVEPVWGSWGEEVFSPQVNIGGTWKDPLQNRINIGGAWKVMNLIKIAIGGVWKNVG